VLPQREQQLALVESNYRAAQHGLFPWLVLVGRRFTALDNPTAEVPSPESDV
jgi:hypothetical protein